MTVSGPLGARFRRRVARSRPGWRSSGQPGTSRTGYGSSILQAAAMTPGIRPYARCHDTHLGILWARARHTIRERWAAAPIPGYHHTVLTHCHGRARGRMRHSMEDAPLALASHHSRAETRAVARMSPRGIRHWNSPVGSQYARKLEPLHA